MAADAPIALTPLEWKEKPLKEMIERLMHAAGWMPKERERVLDELLQEALSDKLAAEQEVIELRSNLARAESSWERAEERVRELESDYVMVNRSRARAMLLKDKLAAISRRIDDVIGA